MDLGKMLPKEMNKINVAKNFKVRKTKQRKLMDLEKKRYKMLDLEYKKKNNGMNEKKREVGRRQQICQSEDESQHIAVWWLL